MGGECLGGERLTIEVETQGGNGRKWESERGREKVRGREGERERERKKSVAFVCIMFDFK